MGFPNGNAHDFQTLQLLKGNNRPAPKIDTHYYSTMPTSHQTYAESEAAAAAAAAAAVDMTNGGGGGDDSLDDLVMMAPSTVTAAVGKRKHDDMITAVAETTAHHHHHHHDAAAIATTTTTNDPMLMTTTADDEMLPPALPPPPIPQAAAALPAPQVLHHHNIPNTTTTTAPLLMIRPSPEGLPDKPKSKRINWGKSPHKERLTTILNDWFSKSGQCIDEHSGLPIPDYRVYASKVGISRTTLFKYIHKDPSKRRLLRNDAGSGTRGKKRLMSEEDVRRIVQELKEGKE